MPRLLRSIKSASLGTALVVQWLRIHLAMQGMRVRSLVKGQSANMLQSN